jgi:hypothetical protein
MHCIPGGTKDEQVNATRVLHTPPQARPGSPSARAICTLRTAHVRVQCRCGRASYRLWANQWRWPSASCFQEDLSKTVCSNFVEIRGRLCLSSFSSSVAHRPTNSGRTSLTPFSRGNAPLFLGCGQASTIECKEGAKSSASINRKFFQHFLRKTSCSNSRDIAVTQLLASDTGRLATAMDERRDMPTRFTFRFDGLAYARSSALPCARKPDSALLPDYPAPGCPSRP